MKDIRNTLAEVFDEVLEYSDKLIVIIKDTKKYIETIKNNKHYRIAKS
jgi:uncharacterized pyridoxamine 5'-phosphate oxidase family protein